MWKWMFCCKPVVQTTSFKSLISCPMFPFANIKSLPRLEKQAFSALYWWMFNLNGQKYAALCEPNKVSPLKLKVRVNFFSTWNTYKWMFCYLHYIQQIKKPCWKRKVKGNQKNLSSINGIFPTSLFVHPDTSDREEVEMRSKTKTMPCDSLQTVAL